MSDDEWTFRHAGASAHKTKMTKPWLEDNVPHQITSGPQGERPRSSPDINWIKNVWAYMDEQMEANPHKVHSRPQAPIEEDLERYAAVHVGYHGWKHEKWVFGRDCQEKGVHREID